jgi:hypothetical protein
MDHKEIVLNKNTGDDSGHTLLFSKHHACSVMADTAAGMDSFSGMQHPRRQAEVDYFLFLQEQIKGIIITPWKTFDVCASGRT